MHCNLVSALGAYAARMGNVDEVPIRLRLHVPGPTPGRTEPAQIAELRLRVETDATWADLASQIRDGVERQVTQHHDDMPSPASDPDGAHAGRDDRARPADCEVDAGLCRAVARYLDQAPREHLTLSVQLAGDGSLTPVPHGAPERSEPAVGDHRARVSRLLRAADATPDGAVRDVDLPTARDRRRLLRECNDTAAPLPDTTLPAAFDAQAARTPDRIAVEYGSEIVSYAQLRARVDRLASELAAGGVRPGDRVGLLMKRSTDLVAALLAVAKAGAAYVPLDLRYPASTMGSILDRVGASLVVVDETTSAHELPAGRRTMRADQDGDVVHAGAVADATPGSGAVLYVMHTSGSTGEPRGVEVTHRNVLALALDRVWRGGAHERVLLHSPHAFDASTYELWVPLLSGGRVVICDEDVDALLLRRLAGQGRITALWLTAGLFSALAEGDPACLDGVREVWTGGDVVSPRAVERVAAACREITIYNGYGPTETTTFATRYRIHPGGRTGDDIPIGTPMDNTRVYVLDERRRLLPPGAVGHLHVAGDHVARGYAGLPELTEERFVPDPFGGPGERMYATGDLARWQDDGTLRFLGRADSQVKVHGFRVELGEIESVLTGHPQVSQVAVVIQRLDDGDKRIVAYALPDDPRRKPDAEALRGYLADRLPAFMVPADIEVLTAMPLNANGKVDRRRLCELAAPAGRKRGPAAQDPPAGADAWPEGVAAGDRSEGPRPLCSSTEHSLAALWSELLDAPVTSGDASFWDLGGHSLLGVTLVARIRERLGARLRLRDLFRHPLLADLAAFIDAAGADVGAAPRQPRLAASDFQQRVWLAERLEPEPGLYNVPFAWRVTGRLDPRRLAAALARVVERHEALRTTFVQRHGELCQVVGPPWLPVVDRNRCDGDAELAAQLRAEADRPFDLARGPLLRASVVDCPSGQVMTLTVHHIVFDAASLPLLLGELSRYYEDATAPGPAGYQYRDLLAAEERARPEAVRRRAELLRGAPSRLDTAPPVQPEPHGLVPLALPADLVERMRPLQDELGMSWFMVSAAALAGLLHRWTGSDDLTFGFPTDTRSRSEFAGVIGPCLNTVVVRSTCDPETTVAQLLEANRDAVLDAIDDQHVPFGALVDALHPARSAGSTPYLDVVLAPQAASATRPDVGGVELTTLSLAAGAGATGKFALTVALTVAGDAMTGAFLYRGDRLSAATAAGLARMYERMLEAVLGDRERALATLDLTLAGDASLRGALPAPSGRGGRAAPNGSASGRGHGRVEALRGHPQQPGPPESEAEQRIAAIWSSLLDTRDIGVNDNFFDRGGNSLKLVALHAELCRTFHLDLPIQQLFESPTVRTMARFLDEGSSPADVHALGPGPQERVAARRRHQRRAARS